MKSSKIEINDFNISLTLSKEEAKQLNDILNVYISEHINPVADGIVNELRQYELYLSDKKNEESEKKAAIIEFTYKGKDGSVSQRRVEVYSIKLKILLGRDDRISFYGKDLDNNETRTFLFEGMFNIFINGKRYSTIYDIGRKLFNLNPDISFSGFRSGYFDIN